MTVRAQAGRAFRTSSITVYHRPTSRSPR